MILKICKFCGGEIKKPRAKIFCSNLCQERHYNRRPEIREKNRINMREFRKDHPEWRERHRVLAVTKYRERRRKYWKEYGKRPEVRARINERDRIRRKIDKQYAVADRLRRSFNHALLKYSKRGKIMNSIKYGINWKETINGLKPFPENLKNFEIDHLLPLRSFNLNDSEQIKKAFSPENLQWLTKEENRRKSSKILDYR
ncbi:MAG TPA: hypothetical protein ENG87_00075 [Candidatus Pacearchaeota archaeon]|nr:hypothetical protein BMS3Abin17_00904 [archaeon BMS3Abin17]HDK41747.1 hypothetical protein [Candidatus Pacearchaeota archaeon]HDZ61387.1 hypothetical protein [Candidatus Pacearchaeota archaeon]